MSSPSAAPQPLRLVPKEPEAVHPLTSLATPILPGRDSAAAPADVWEELDRAAAWVCDHAGAELAPTAPGGGAEDRNALRRALRVVCVAARSADLAGAQGATPALRAGDLPWDVPIGPVVRALRQRLLAQTLDARATGAPSADAAAVLRVLAALDRLDEVARTDATRIVLDQLTGVTALDLLVEVAHDMRSPLGSILFLVERLRTRDAVAGTAASGPLTEAQDRQLALIYGAAFGLSAMVGDVMELARGGDRLAVDEPAPLALPELVESVAAIVRPLAEEKRLTLVAVDAPREQRLGHAAAIHRVLLNLVTNALKYTPQGSVTLRAEAFGRGRVRFTIQDTGRGIPAHVLANLFQTFRRQPTRTHAFSNAGLGLAICQKLIRRMGGELHVESELGRGTRFSFDLELPPVATGY